MDHTLWMHHVWLQTRISVAAAGNYIIMITLATHQWDDGQNVNCWCYGVSLYSAILCSQLVCYTGWVIMARMLQSKAHRTRSRFWPTLTNCQSVTHSNQLRARSRLHLEQIVADSKKESGANRVGSDSRKACRTLSRLWPSQLNWGQLTAALAHSHDSCCTTQTAADLSHLGLWQRTNVSAMTCHVILRRTVIGCACLLAWVIKSRTPPRQGTFQADSSQLQPTSTLYWRTGTPDGFTTGLGGLVGQSLDTVRRA